MEARFEAAAAEAKAAREEYEAAVRSPFLPHTTTTHKCTRTAPRRAAHTPHRHTPSPTTLSGLSSSRAVRAASQAKEHAATTAALVQAKAGLALAAEPAAASRRSLRPAGLAALAAAALAVALSRRRRPSLSAHVPPFGVRSHSRRPRPPLLGVRTRVAPRGRRSPRLRWCDPASHGGGLLRWCESGQAARAAGATTRLPGSKWRPTEPGVRG